MTDTTERAELLALADRIDAWANLVSNGFYVPDACVTMNKAASVLRRLSHQPAPAADDAGAEATYRVGRWLSAALEDPNVCAEMKSDINAWMEAGKPNVQPSGNASAEARVKYLEDEREALRAEAAVNSRLIDEIADFMGCRQGEELTLCHIKQQISTLREKLGVALAGDLQHKSDCAVYLAPAYEPRECDCGAKDASDCEKQVPSGYSEYTPIKVVGSTSEPRGCLVPGACSCPSDRTADVTVEELADFILDNGCLVVGDDEEEGLAQALLSAFTVGRR